MNNKEAILAAALELFGEQGYDRSPTSQIARRAGVSEGLIFRHFGNKEGLLSAIIEQGLAEIASTMRPYSDPGISPEQAIAQHIENALTVFRANAKFWRVATQLRFQPGINAAVGAQIESGNRFIVAQLTEHFRQAGSNSPEIDALLLFAQIDGICLHWLQMPDSYPIDDILKKLTAPYPPQHSKLPNSLNP
jgi:AcrR family transcriptional regulator